MSDLRGEAGDGERVEPPADAAASTPDVDAAGSTARPRVPALVAAAITFLLFLPACKFPFVNFDDFANVAHNRYINPTVTLAGLARFWRGSYEALYAPITFSIWAACAVIARLHTPIAILGQSTTTLNPAVFHTVGVLLHVVNVLFVFGILRLLLPRLSIDDPEGRAAAVGAALYGVHPMQVESVAWITGHNNVFSGVFALATIYVYLRGVVGTENGADSGPWRVRRAQIGATILYALALLAKPTATAVPLMLIALEVIVLRRSARRWIGLLGVWIVAALLFAVVISAGAEHAFDIVTPLWQRPFVVGDALSFYLVKLVWPNPLTMEYDHGIARVVGNWWGYATWLLPAGVALLLWRLGPKARPFRAGYALLIAGLLPVLGLVPYYFQPISTVADRYLYLAMLGPALILAAVASKVADRPSWRLLPLLALGVLAWISAGQIRVWRDPYTLLQHILAYNDSSYLAHEEMGTILIDRQDWAGAEREYRAVLRCNPNFELGYASLASVLEHEGRNAEAEAEWDEYVHASPNNADAQFQAARICFTSGRVDNSLTATRRTLELRPDYPGARELLGKLLAIKASALAPGRR